MGNELQAMVCDDGFFCDPDFPVDAIQLPETGEKDISWARPCDLRENPEMFVEGASRFDVLQGNLSDCWFLSACAAIAENPDLLIKVIPEGQTLHGEGYDGSVTFRFWNLGLWEEVRIDDRLPVKKDKSLLFAKCKNESEFWLPLLEKAYAKFHGSYKVLSAGQLSEGVVHLTGFSTEPDFSRGALTLQEFFKNLRNEWKSSSLILFGIHERDKWGGLPGWHAYTVTGFETIRHKSRLVRLVRVRNPHGKNEWTGPWSDSDSVWEELSDAVKKELKYGEVEDGEYWMKFSHFTQVYIVNCVARKVPTMGDLQDISEDCHSNVCIQVTGQWKPEGPPDRFRSFACNQQFLLVAEDSDEPDNLDDDGLFDKSEADSEDGPTCSVFLELMQEHNRRKWRSSTEIGFYVFKREEEKPMSVEEIEDEDHFATMQFVKQNAVHLRLSLKPKVPYIVVVGPRRIKEPQKFLLRAFARKPCIRLEELHNEEMPKDTVSGTENTAPAPISTQPLPLTPLTNGVQTIKSAAKVSLGPNIAK